MKITRSLRWRIQLWHGMFLVLLLAGLGVAAWHYERQRTQRLTDDMLSKRLGLVFDSLPRREGDGPGRRPPPPEDDDGFRPPPRGRGRDRPEFRLSPEGWALFKGETYFVVWRENETVAHHSDNVPADVPIPEKLSGGNAETLKRERGIYREVFLFTPPGDCLLVGTSMEKDRAELRSFAWQLSGIGVVILTIGLGGGWWMISRSLRPLGAITEAAAEISEGKLERRIGLKADDSELGQLAVRLNETFAKLEESFARQARFTSDAAHELRTPLSVVISQAQLALRGERTGEEYREMFEASLRGAKRMQALTQSLLELARIDNGAGGRMESCDLKSLAAEALDAVSPAAGERRAKIRAELGDASCAADVEAVTRVMVNLLNNALDHGGDDIRTATSSDENGAWFSVTDDGPGIPPEHVPHLFERFYRADASRNRKTGGSGLGLAICKAIIDAHGGKIEVKSEAGKGTAFSFFLPRR